jgi:type IV pilus assembly protein PilV
MIKTKRIQSFVSHQQGVVLLESLIAILIFSLGILGLVGLQAATIKGTAEAKYRAQASYVAQQRIGALWVDQANLADYAEEDADISNVSGLPNGKRSTIRANGSDNTCKDDLTCFTVIVSWQQPGSNDVHNVTMVSRVTGEKNYGE